MAIKGESEYELAHQNSSGRTTPEMEDAPLNPPSYDAEPSSSAGTSQHPTTNFLVIERALSNIKGGWRVDTNKKMPVALFPPLPEGSKPRANLFLDSVIGNITAEVQLLADRTKPRALISANSAFGSSVEIRIVAPAQQRFRINSQTIRATITVYIPRWFAGPIYTSTMMGSVKFSSAIAPQIATFAERGGNNKYFLGDYDSTGFGEQTESEWEGDELTLASFSGDIIISYDDERVSEEELAKMSFWTRCFKR
ncbi:hypothetical protein SISNIDRAFT_517911 [Sistotremastrum niveocremeum HHB9708]|uniref:DUF7330 domain-containing protein n=2 Tax=Sistotremastraceae TaxID=3402574 RepID=A0A164S2V5_9AGAM|nr:hypothetical protein SISNIDRAFT_517911 [Sistotremastrum niveocremeum HHB9708]KZT40891.1 hypothetical protein SISSUDRAFT_1059936 [Sistotremastrum suecicum HHB10207 ss-3]